MDSTSGHDEGALPADSLVGDGAVRYDRVDSTAWITLDRPAAHNALNAALRTGLWGAVRQFNDDDLAHVAVLRGAGPSFCAGGDLKEMSSSEMSVPQPDYLPYFNRNVDVVKPIIAAVHGRAFGGGFLLAQMADLCVASKDALFAIPEARWGRGAPWAAPVTTMIPRRIAMQLLLTGRPITAGRAYEVGLVNETVDPDALTERCTELAESIAGNAPLTLRASKAMVYDSATMGWREALEHSDALFRPVYLSADAQEGPRAFVEGRAPRWQGR